MSSTTIGFASVGPIRMSVPKYSWAIIDEYRAEVLFKLKSSGPTPGNCWLPLPIPPKKSAALRLIRPGVGSLPLLVLANVRNDWWICFICAASFIVLAFRCAFASAGSNSPMSSAMIAITTSSSIKVKAFVRLMS